MSSGNIYHPKYATEDGDITLVSFDDVKFNVHSVMLRKASSVFDDMIKMPIPKSNTSLTENDIKLDEPAYVWAFLLDAIYPQDTFPSVANYGEAWAIVKAVDKYCFERVLIILRTVILSNDELRNQSLRLYSLARKCQWTDIVASSSKDSLKKSLKIHAFDPEYTEQLLELSKADATDLARFHGTRSVEILRFGTRAISNWVEQSDLFYDDHDEPREFSLWHCPGRCDGSLGDEERVHAALEAFKCELGAYLELEPAATALFDRGMFGGKFEELSRISGFKWICCNICKKPFVNEERAWDHFKKVGRRIPSTVFESVKPEVGTIVLSSPTFLNIAQEISV